MDGSPGTTQEEVVEQVEPESMKSSVADERSSDPGTSEGFRIKIGWKVTAIVIIGFTLLAVVNVLFIRGKFDSVMNRVAPPSNFCRCSRMYSGER